MADPVTIQPDDVFIVVDVQNDFCPGGSLAVPDGDAVVPVINRVARSFAHVVLTQDWHPAGHGSFASSHPGRAPFETITMPYGEQVTWPDHCVQATNGAAFHPDLDIAHAELVIRKGYRGAIDSYSAFFENDHTTPTGLAGYLRERGLNRIFVAGLALDFCVRYSAEDALACGFETVLIDDACRAIDNEGSLEAARASFAAKGVSVIESAQIRS
ncbi:MAG TPA: bifunctional nicotinamidase/pyrazinamidase [Alphaproteobacteria bacterium]|nr:bifunctional nicotinamidase/pyrazinamidase [Alphaproteobacteria bacterium]